MNERVYARIENGGKRKIFCFFKLAGLNKGIYLQN